MEYKRQLNWDDWVELSDAANLLATSLCYISDDRFLYTSDPEDMERHLDPCWRTARKIAKMLRNMEVVKVPEPASGCNGSTTGEGSGV